MTAPLLDRVDRIVGDGVDRTVRAHHRRRLRRLGWERALAPSGDGWWAQGEPPPRPGNRLDVLIDGEQALPAIARALAAARSHVHLTGWHLTAGLELVRGEGPPVVLGELLAALAQRIPVRVLLWAGAPVPVFHPSRAEVRAARRELCHETRIDCRLDARERPLHCHHEKTIVIDDEIAFVGGIDLSDFAGDRYDTAAHRARRRLGWHDVATRLEGPAVADVAAHFRMRWREVAGEELPAPPAPGPAGACTVQVLRTVPERVYDAVPRGDFRILEAYVRALRGARRFVYLENQFLWSSEISEILAGKLRDPPTSDFRLLLVLPSKANNGQDDTRG
jgi:phosphatidylserine/phosphatidylglycerophosphate/cardiolipin synthase-like enzyme